MPITDVETQLVHVWPGPPWAVVVACAAIGAWLYFVVRREQAMRPTSSRRIAMLAGLRAAAIVCVVLLLFGWTRQRHRTALPELAIGIDTSASMATLDADESRSRLAATLAQFEQRDGAILEELRKRYQLVWYALGGEARRVHREQAESAESRATAAPRQDGADVPSASGADKHKPASDETQSGVDHRKLPSAVARLEPTDGASRLGLALRDILRWQRGQPTAAVVLWSDGVTTDGPALSQSLAQSRQQRVPVYCVAVGSEKAPLDLRLGDLLVDEVVFLDDLVPVDVRLSANGAAGREAIVRLRRSDNGELLAEQRVVAPESGRAESVQLSFRPREPGSLELRVEVEPLEGERNIDDNHVARTISVREETLKVLYVQSYPSYDFRYLKTLLARQLQPGGDANAKAIELTSVLQEADPDSVAQDETSAATPPATREELFRYDVVIFGDVNPAVLGASLLDHLHEFVAGRGGGLVVLSGPKFTPLAYRDTPLASLLPINLDSATAPPADSSFAAEARVRLAPLGQGSPVLQLADAPAANLELWKQLPPWYWWIEAGEVRPGARVLAEHPTRADAEGRPLPMVCVQFIGAGKVVFHASDESWRWSRGPAGEQAYARYWLQTLRYLSRSKLAAAGRSAQLTSDRDEYEQGDVGRLRVRFFDERRAPADDQGVSIVLERDGGRRQTLRLGRDSTGRADFTAAMPLSSAGSYRAWMATPAVEGQPPEARFRVVAPPGEQARLAVDLEELKTTAQLSGGKLLRLAEAPRLLDLLPRGGAVRVEPLPPEPIWNRWPVAMLVLGLLALEWSLRKKWDLL